WVEHPLLVAYRADNPSHSLFHEQHVGREDLARHSRECYRREVAALEGWLIRRGVDTGTARKQARGASRGDLGNALQTEMIFSASVAQWRRMIRQRSSIHADAEIRVIYEQVIRELKRSRYAESFADIGLVPSLDGIGQVAEFRTV